MIYFISGHRNITQEEFDLHYKNQILNVVNSDNSFVVGDCVGVDAMAQELLKDNGCDDVTVYHMFTSPRHNAGFKTVGGFNSDVDRDFAMTVNSNIDIAWTRKGCERSGTGLNIKRRNLYNEGKLTKYNIIQNEAHNFL